ncbi:hypothetical protein CCM_01669 [Cordyceps militaris CM01]|uniref:Uncharacterized protein n=1 Tax=Cordyceps militaris (strain CM01) TaxID=983644 RepID=G3J6I2_CORMM|nr:uncharacterized protein CCM_01669 [Cordyceps militaris CM01]EGX97010.1 hypothetical protein CCM_01669 [Cordyceps militaris CM01]
MSAINRSLEQSRLEIMILAIGVLVLVSLLGLIVFINLRFRPRGERKRQQNDYGYNQKPGPSSEKYKYHDTFLQSVRRRSISLADNAKREFASLTRRATLSVPVDATAIGPDVKPQPEHRRFRLVPSTNTEATNQEPVQDDHEYTRTASSGNDAGHDETGQKIVMI